MTSFGFSFLPLKRGVKIADFHSKGILPDNIQSLNKFVIELTRFGTNCFMIFVGIPETPGPLRVSIDAIVFSTMVFVINRDLNCFGLSF